MTNNLQQNPESQNVNNKTEKKTWVAPSLMEEVVSETKSGVGPTLPNEGATYHS
ncbi:MAG: hypothetical protein ACTHKV_09805 [Flavipsychrobacter sp.]